MSYRRSASQRVLGRALLPDTFSRALYKLAPYKGCAHGCKYCDGRAEKYYVEGDFERDIEIREGIPGILRRELPRLRERGMIAFGSGVTDPYQPCEAVEGTVRDCASILASSEGPEQGDFEGITRDNARAEDRRSFPALVMTKSSLVLRDIDLWSRVHQRAGFVLFISLACLDESLRSVMEPGASSFAARLETIREFKRAGCVVGVLAMPFLPYLTDTSESIEFLYAECTKIGVDFLMPGGLTLRPGRQKELFLSVLGRYRNDLGERVKELYREDRSSGVPVANYSRELYARIREIRKVYPIPWLLPQAAMSRLMPSYDLYHIVLRDMLELYSDRGIETRRLLEGAQRYDAWLIALKHEYRRHRSYPLHWLDERFDESIRTGALEKILGNPRLFSFISHSYKEKLALNYLSLELDSI